jgi:hypothetical protein
MGKWVNESMNGHEMWIEIPAYWAVFTVVSGDFNSLQNGPVGVGIQDRKTLR